MIDIYKISTRILDIFFSFLAILVLSPVLLIVMAILFFTGEREVFYIQERIGRGNSLFPVIKFATMIKNSPNLGAGAITVTGDSRVLPVGRFLRKAKINELPQLFNILRGDMSFVGPRPLMPKQFGFYDIDTQKQISKMRPGLTGAGSIIFRNEEKYFVKGKNNDDVYRSMIAPAKAIVETWYLENQSVYLYLKLIFITFLSVLMPRKEFFGFLDSKTKDKLFNVLR